MTIPKFISIRIFNSWTIVSMKLSFLVPKFTTVRIFKSGTIVYVKFSGTTAAEDVRSAVEKGGIKDARIQGYGPAANNERENLRSLYDFFFEVRPLFGPRIPCKGSK